MIVQPLGRILMRVDSRVNEAVEKWTDPILLAFGILTYGLRLAQIAARDQGDDDQGKKPPERVPPAPRDNGKPLTEDVPPAGPPVEILGLVGSGGMAVENG